MEKTLVNKYMVDSYETYNLCVGGHGPGKFSKESIEKNRLSNTGKVITESTRLKMSRSSKGQVISKETRSKISKALKGRRHTESSKRKMSLAMTGVPIHSEEFKSRMSKESSERQDRPWKHAFNVKNTKRLEVYKHLDKIYPLYLEYLLDPAKWGRNKRFNSKVLNLTGCEVTVGVLRYFKTYGNPIEDFLWLKFKGERGAE